MNSSEVHPHPHCPDLARSVLAAFGLCCNPQPGYHFFKFFEACSNKQVRRVRVAVDTFVTSYRTLRWGTERHDPFQRLERNALNKSTELVPAPLPALTPDRLAVQAADAH